MADPSGGFATIGTAALLVGVNKLVSHCLNSSGSYLGSIFSAKKSRDFLKTQLLAKAQFITHVKTIWRVEESVPIDDFFLNPKISIFNNTIEVNSIHDFSHNRVLVQGLAGQGKSILLRFLAAREFAFGEILPIFIELKNVGPSVQLNDLINEYVRSLGIIKPEEAMNQLGNEKRLAFFLDAFDECSGAFHQELYKDINSIAMKWPGAKIIISSRPNSGAEYFGAFVNTKICPLANDDYVRVIRRNIWFSEFADETLKALKKAPSITDLLTTPLMVSLLMLRFVCDKTLPENEVNFFGDFFELLVRRHDMSKGFFNRDRKSDLDDQQLRRAYNLLSFHSRKRLFSITSGLNDPEQVFSISAFEEYAAIALDYEASGSKPSELLKDLCNITNLLIKADNQFNYPHKSIQEFHSASFIKEQESRLSFYKQMLVSWTFWEQELRFLFLLDRDAFLTGFLIPDIERAIRIPKDEKNLSKKHIISFLDHFLLTIDETEERGKSFRIFPQIIMPLDSTYPCFALSSYYANLVDLKLNKRETVKTAPAYKLATELENLDWSQIEAKLRSSKRSIIKSGSVRVSGLTDQGKRRSLQSTSLGLIHRSNIHRKLLTKHAVSIIEELQKTLSDFKAEVSRRSISSIRSFEF